MAVDLRVYPNTHQLSLDSIEWSIAYESYLVKEKVGI
jgi:hypothetical protein